MPPELVLDLKFAYSAQEAYQSLQEMGESRRSDYITCLLIFDIPYMVIYSLLFIQLLNFLWKDNRFQIICFGILGFDLLENVAVFILVNIFPVYSPAFGFVASFFTSAKWICVGILVLVVFVGALKRLFSKDRRGIL